MTQKRIKELFDLDEKTGELFWKIKPCRNIKIGDIAGNINDRGRWVIQINRKTYPRSRLIFLYVKGYLPREVDHEDLNRLNDRPGNLRAATKAQNQQNCPGKPNRNLPKGVYFKPSRKKPFFSKIRVNGTTIYLGSFLTPEETHQAYRLAAIKFHGIFARFN
jgi:HNH endonuclease